LLNACADAIVASSRPISQSRSHKFYDSGIGGRTSLPIPKCGREVTRKVRTESKEMVWNNGRVHSSDIQPTVTVSTLLCSGIRRSVYF